MSSFQKNKKIYFITGRKQNLSCRWIAQCQRRFHPVWLSTLPLRSVWLDMHSFPSLFPPGCWMFRDSRLIKQSSPVERKLLVWSRPNKNIFTRSQRLEIVWFSVLQHLNVSDDLWSLRLHPRTDVESLLTTIFRGRILGWRFTFFGLNSCPDISNWVFSKVTITFSRRNLSDSCSCFSFKKEQY